MNRKKLQSILVCAVCTVSAAGAAMPAHTASAESFTYPVQEFRFAVGDTDRNLNTSGTAPGDYVTSETQNGTDAEIVVFEPAEKLPTLLVGAGAETADGVAQLERDGRQGAAEISVVKRFETFLQKGERRNHRVKNTNNST